MKKKLATYLPIPKGLLLLIFCWWTTQQFAFSKSYQKDSLVQLCIKQFDQKQDSAYVLASYIFKQDSTSPISLFLFAKANYLQKQDVVGDYYLQKLLQKDSLNFSALVLHASRLLSTNQMDDASKSISYIQHYFPNEPLSLYLKGNLYAQAGDHENALKLYEQAILINPNLKEAILQRANIYFQKQAFEKAVTDYESVLELIVEDPILLNNYGIALLSTLSAKHAEDAFKRSIAMDSTHPSVYYNLGLAYMKSSHFAQARAAFKHNLAHSDSILSDIHYLIGKCYEKEGLLEPALVEFEKHTTQGLQPIINKEIWLIKATIFLSKYWYVLAGALCMVIALLLLLIRKKRD